MSTMLLLLRCRPCLYVHQPSGDGQEETRVGFLPSRASFYSVCCGLFFLQAVSESFGLVFEIIGGIFDLISGVFDFALQVLALAFTFSLLITGGFTSRSEEHTSELQSRGHLVCRLLLEKKKNIMCRS